MHRCKSVTHLAEDSLVRLAELSLLDLHLSEGELLLRLSKSLLCAFHSLVFLVDYLP